MSIEIKYCHRCGEKISPEDIRKGKFITYQNKDYCGKCHKEIAHLLPPEARQPLAQTHRGDTGLRKAVTPDSKPGSGLHRSIASTSRPKSETYPGLQPVRRAGSEMKKSDALGTQPGPWRGFGESGLSGPGHPRRQHAAPRTFRPTVSDERYHPIAPGRKLTHLWLAGALALVTAVIVILLLVLPTALHETAAADAFRMAESFEALYPHKFDEIEERFWDICERFHNTKWAQKSREKIGRNAIAKARRHAELNPVDYDRIIALFKAAMQKSKGLPFEQGVAEELSRYERARDRWLEEKALRSELDSIIKYRDTQPEEYRKIIEDLEKFISKASAHPILLAEARELLRQTHEDWNSCASEIFEDIKGRVECSLKSYEFKKALDAIEWFPASLKFGQWQEKLEELRREVLTKEAIYASEPEDDDKIGWQNIALRDLSEWEQTGPATWVVEEGQLIGTNADSRFGYVLKRLACKPRFLVEFEVMPVAGEGKMILYLWHDIQNDVLIGGDFGAGTMQRNRWYKVLLKISGRNVWCQIEGALEKRKHILREEGTPPIIGALAFVLEPGQTMRFRNIRFKVLE